MALYHSKTPRRHVKNSFYACYTFVRGLVDSGKGGDAGFVNVLFIVAPI